MTNEFKGYAAHSAECFGESRDNWWNADYISMLAQHWELSNVRRVLDVGSGLGHWGRVLAAVLPADAQVTGVDREVFWVEKAKERAARAGVSDRFDYQVSSAESLPFSAQTFDLVTCQTLLIHVGDPACVLSEMVRVTRPGGLVIVAEPTNMTGPIIDFMALDNEPRVASRLFEFQLVCERGKRLLGEGNNSLGESLPRLLVEAGLESVSIRQNDRVIPLIPPYVSEPARKQIEETLDTAERGMWIWDQSTTKRYFTAGGGHESEFTEQWSEAMAQQARIAKALHARTYSSAGGSLFYIGWGRRPDPTNAPA